MAHIHAVKDTDVHYKIDGITRTIINIDETKRMLVQGDHNSERLTFEVPRFIDGHDLMDCNLVQVHYVNADVYEKNRSPGFYDVDDMQIKGDEGDDENVVLLTWLVSGNATKYIGTLNFSIRFSCVNNGIVEYVWNTTTYKGITILEGIYVSDFLAENDIDIFAQWEGRIFALEEDVSKIINGTASGENGNNGSGITVTEKNLILSLFSNAAYTSDVSAIISQLESLWNGSGDIPDIPDVPIEPDVPVIPVYTVTNNLTGVINDNQQTEVTEGFYSASLSWEDGHELNNIVITMGGIDITDQVYGEGSILITEVTGDIIITAEAGLPAPAYLLKNKTFDGSAEQIIDTGISLFDNKQKDWSIYIALTTDDETHTSNRFACWHKSVESAYPNAVSVFRGQWHTNWSVNAVTSQYKVSDNLAKCAVIITHIKGENGLKYYGVVGGELVTGDVACRGYGTDGTLKIGGAYNYEETTEAGLFIGTINTAEAHLRVLTEAEIKEKLGVA